MDVKNKILLVATGIFTEKGITGTKVDDIAHEVGVSKKTIYKYFKSKNDLVLEVFSTKISRINQLVEQQFSSDIPFTKKLVAVIEIAKNNLTFVSPVLVADARTEFPAIKGYIDQYMKYAMFDRFNSLLKQGKELGVVKDDLNIESTILLYRDAIFAFVMMRNSKDLPGTFHGLSPLNSFCESLTTIFRGILNEDAEKEFNNYLLSSSKDSAAS